MIVLKISNENVGQIKISNNFPKFWKIVLTNKNLGKKFKLNFAQKFDFFKKRKICGLLYFYQKLSNLYQKCQLLVKLSNIIIIVNKNLFLSNSESSYKRGIMSGYLKWCMYSLLYSLGSVGSNRFALRPCLLLLCTNMLSETANSGPSTQTCVDIMTYKQENMIISLYWFSFIWLFDDFFRDLGKWI